MPDVHLGIGATVGSVIPTLGAIIPAAVGVDIGCGMMACKTTLTARRPAGQPGAAALGDRARGAARPRAGRAATRAPGARPPGAVDTAWAELEPRVRRAVPRLSEADEDQQPRAPGHARHRQPLHRGLPRRRAAPCGSCCTRARAASATRSARIFIELAKQDALRNNANLPDQDLAYFEEGARYFGDYVRAVGWAQKFARAEPRGDDAPRDRGRADGDRQALPERTSRR